MVEPWWPLLGAATPAVLAAQALRMKKKRTEEQSGRGRAKCSDEISVCGRVCTSKKMLKKVDALSRDLVAETYVTVCGGSEIDAVCVNQQHQAPHWNDVCLRGCQSECL